MGEEKKVTYVSTDLDFWNAADGSYFFVKKNEAKPLPDTLTAIIEDALDNRYLREATQTEIDNYLLDLEVQKAVAEGKIEVGINYDDTVKKYKEFVKEIH